MVGRRPFNGWAQAVPMVGSMVERGPFHDRAQAIPWHRPSHGWARAIPWLGRLELSGLVLDHLLAAAPSPTAAQLAAAATH